MTKELVCIGLSPFVQNDDYIRRRRACCDRQHLQKGQEFAVSEMTDPRRTVCTTVRTAFPSVPVLPVRVSGPIPKNRIFDLMHEVNRITVSKRLGREEVVVPNILNLGVDLIATSNILKDEKKQP